MIYNEAISNLRGSFNLVNADNKLTNRFMYNLIQKHSSWLIKQESDKMFLYKSDQIWQTLSCIELIEVPLTDDCCKYNGPSCKIYRSKDPLPKILEDAFGMILKSVNSIDFSKEVFVIKLKEWLRKKLNPDSKYDKNLYAFIKNNYIYTPNVNWKLLSLTAYFKDDITKYNICCNTKEDACIPILDTEWRIPSYLEARVLSACMDELVKTYLQSKDDNQVDKNTNNIGQ